MTPGARYPWAQNQTPAHRFATGAFRVDPLVPGARGRSHACGDGQDRDQTAQTLTSDPRASPVTVQRPGHPLTLDAAQDRTARTPRNPHATR